MATAQACVAGSRLGVRIKRGGHRLRGGIFYGPTKPSGGTGRQSLCRRYEEQARFARQMCHGLPIQIRYQDYRGLEGTFDRVLSVGMFEHVGPKNYATFMDVVRRCLKEDGLFLLHTIGAQKAAARCEPWIARYIFPNSKLPSAREICATLEDRFILEDWQNFGADYDRTLMQWFRNFQENWVSLRDGYDERFFRMWKYYLLSCAGAFRARANQLWQIVLSPRGVPGGYRIARDWRVDVSQGIESEKSMSSL